MQKTNKHAGTFTARALLNFSIILTFVILLVNPAYTFLTNKPLDLLKWPSQFFLLVYSIIWMLLVPIGIIKFIFKMKLKDFGLQFPTDKKKAFYLIIFFYLALTPPLIWFTKKIQAYYVIKSLNFNEFLFIQLIILPIYYFAEEFFFRGFIFIKLWDKIRWQSVWITEFLFAFAHIGKPGLEIIFSIPVGFVLNYVTYNSRSIVPAILIHYYIGSYANIRSFFNLN